MWKVYIKGNYLFVEKGNIQHRRLKEYVEARKPSTGSTEYHFFDRRTTQYFKADILELEDENSIAFNVASFDLFITDNTGL